ncbi:hypothetical protein SLA2020_248490 [Shorea laevis]
MALSITDNAKKLWDAWNIRGLIILSLSLQAYLILFAPLRKGRFAKKFYVRWPTWFAYLSADWVATYTIGLIFSSDSHSTCTSTSPSPPKDILVFWASFLLLHLGGPDNITSYALEDNEFWKRHLFVLLLQVGFTLYAFLKSFSRNELWLPTILVLFAGIMKYAERNVAFYCASFDHFGKDWVSPQAETRPGLPIPVQFHDTAQFHDTKDHTSLLRTTVKLFGNIKSALVGPLLKEKEQMQIRRTLLAIGRSQKVLQVLELELSLLYEVLHTKLPVIDGKSGFNLRMANFGCILLAIITFSLAKWHYQLRAFDMLLTYGLLIAALALDSLSIMLLVKYSDWYAVAHFKGTVKKDAAASKVIERQHRWCNQVSQLNFLTYHVKGMPAWLNNLADILHLRGSLKVIKGFRCQSSRDFEPELWRFIYYEVRDFPDDARINEVWLERGKTLLKDVMNGKQGKQHKMLDKLDYTQSLLVWHIVTDLCYQKDTKYKPASGRTNYRPFCKLLSDYMFCLAVKQPTIMSSVLDNWSTVFKKISKMIQLKVPWSFSLDEEFASGEILTVEENGTDSVEEVEEENDDYGDKVENSLPSHGEVEISLSSAVLLVHGLKQRDNHYPWKVMSQIWVELMCYAAINCRPNVHAQQLSQGGELLTLIWLLMNHMGLGTKNYTTLKKSSQPPARDPESDSENEDQLQRI